MASSRFIKDTGLTVRMTSVMFLLGALFVGLVVGLMYLAPPQFSVIIGLAGIGVAFWQWWSSDTVAMKAMRAREVSPQEAPELHGMIDRLCALADMPKPRVGIADMRTPNAFATGRSPERAVVCVTTGILQTLNAEELEAVLAHELSHVAHRDVLVMTVASSAGIAAGMLMRGAQYSGLGRSRNHNGGGALVVLGMVAVSMVVYAVSFLLLRLLSRYRELSADRAGAYLTYKPAALASALQKISGESAAIPHNDLRAGHAVSALCIVPAFRGASIKALTATHPPLQQRLEQLARIQTELSRPTDASP
jgi:heat shock protein HtpX